MARWRLMASHYLHTDDRTEWEYSEVDRTTGRPKRVKFKVPTLLDINDPSHWTEVVMGLDNKPAEGSIIVCDGNNPSGRDVIYRGPPTPDMDPLDDEARAITEKYRPQWNWTAGAEAGTYTQSLVDDMQSQLAALQAAQKPQSVEIPGMGDFMKAMAEIQAQNTALLKQLVGARRG